MNLCFVPSRTLPKREGVASLRYFECELAAILAYLLPYCTRPSAPLSFGEGLGGADIHKF
jgi:hypothetical protein